MGQRLLEAMQRAADGEGHLVWHAHYVDGTVVRAHQHAAGAVGAAGGQQHEAPRALARWRLDEDPVRAEGDGKPLGFVLSGGERHESTHLEALLS